MNKTMEHGSYQDLAECWKIQMFLESTAQVPYCDTEVMDLQNNINNNIAVLPHLEHQLLNCGICHRSYNSPKVLPCLHSFCEQCLYEYIPAESLSVTCPVCRQQSILPIDGVSALQANIFITSLMDVVGTETCGVCGTESGRLCIRCETCDKSLCEACEQQHRDDDNLSSHELVSIPTCSLSSESEESTLVCPNHHGNSLQFYCTACETGVCKDCTTVEHIGHNVISL
ncbi:tripartite motif-containing protein 2-like, partial [Ruditapes philippinarum]|uniref:tripartite motif-containing protein 2-like n=1 Tax=Ruditapes philippinarum TaxID=129788 RepID=UPI00295C148F